MDEIGVAESMVLVEAIEQFKQEQFPNYGAYEATGDLNTFGGGAFGVLSERADTIVQRMRQIEYLLAQYANAPSLEKHKLKPAIQAAYKQLHQKFGPILEKYVARARAGEKMPALYSPRRAIKIAANGRVMPLTRGAKSSRVLMAAQGLRWVTRGLVVLDAGIRMYNVSHAKNKTRELFAEATGWAFSTGIGIAGTAAAMALTLGPAGWVIAIIIIGAAAVSMDYLGKYGAHYIYDTFSSSPNSYSTPVLTYP